MLAYPDDLDQQSAAIQWTDWLELCLLFSPSPSLTRSSIFEVFELRHGDTVDAEAIVEDGFANIGERQRLLGDRYPIALERIGPVRRRSREECLSFSFLLALG